MRHDSGITLVKVLLITSILFAVAAYAARSTRIEVRIAQNDYLGKRTLQVAQAGVNHAWRLIEKDLVAGKINVLGDEITGSGPFGTSTYLLSAEQGNSTYQFPSGCSGDSCTLDCTVSPNCRFVSFPGTPTADGYYYRVVNNSDDPGGPGCSGSVSCSDSDNQVLITAVGTVGNSNRAIQALVHRLSFYDKGLFAKYNLTMSGTGGGSCSTNCQTTESYNSATDPGDSINLGSGNIGANGNISLSGTNVVVDGDATAGGTVSPGNSTLNGSATNYAEPASLPPVPACTVGSSYPGITCTRTQGNGSCTAYSGGALSSSNGWNITIPSGTYCFDHAALSGGTVTFTGPVTIYLASTTTASSFSAGSYVNYTQSGYSYASNLQIFSSCTSACGTAGLSFSGSNTFYGAIYAPEAGVALTGGGTTEYTFFGAVVGGNVTTDGHARFRYDEALASITSNVTALADWHEVFN